MYNIYNIVNIIKTVKQKLRSHFLSSRNKKITK